jgi:predicted 2-oxoglutarate/Fe(II)-dependent dioxygenase YbiX
MQDAARRKEAAEEAEWMDGADVKSMQRKAAAEVERKLKAERKKAAEEQLRKEEEEAAALKKKLYVSYGHI